MLPLMKRAMVVGVLGVSLFACSPDAMDAPADLGADLLVGPAPELRMDPPPLTSNMSLTAVLHFTLYADAALAPATAVEPSLVITDPAGTIVTGSFTWTRGTAPVDSKPAWLGVFHPQGGWASDTDYALTLTPSAAFSPAIAFGPEVAARANGTFATMLSTKHAPFVRAVNFVGHAGYQAFFVEFSEPVDTSTATAGVRLLQFDSVVDVKFGPAEDAAATLSLNGSRLFASLAGTELEVSTAIRSPDGVPLRVLGPVTIVDNGAAFRIDVSPLAFCLEFCWFWSAWP